MDGSALTPFAWIFMLLSMGAVTLLTVYCFYRILSGGGVSGGTADPLAVQPPPDAQRASSGGAERPEAPGASRGGGAPPPGAAPDPGAGGP